MYHFPRVPLASIAAFRVLASRLAEWLVPLRSFQNSQSRWPYRALRFARARAGSCAVIVVSFDGNWVLARGLQFTQVLVPKIDHPIGDVEPELERGRPVSGPVRLHEGFRRSEKPKGDPHGFPTGPNRCRVGLIRVPVCRHGDIAMLLSHHRIMQQKVAELL